MNSSKNIINYAKELGFIVNGEFTLTPVNYNTKQFIFYINQNKI